MKIIQVALIFNILHQLAICELSCKNENNQDIEWFIGLKFPKSYKFVYISSQSETWTTSKFDLSSKNNMIGWTIEQTYSSHQSQSFYAYYNDETPKFTYSSRGHLKGVISFDINNGFWLIHSVPLFPTFGNYTYGKAEEIYGQSFICVSLESENLQNIVIQLLLMQSTVYSYNLPENFPVNDKLKTLLTNFINNKNMKIQQTNMTIIMKTLKSLPLVHFGKSYSFGQDLYSGLVAPGLQASIMVESWIRGEKVDSTCGTDYHVYNVEKVNLPGAKFRESHDHSKWAVSNNQDSPYVCIGDINRMTSQFKRGGGTLCVKNKNIWKIFQPIVADFEKCANFLPVFHLKSIL